MRMIISLCAATMYMVTINGFSCQETKGTGGICSVSSAESVEGPQTGAEIDPELAKKLRAVTVIVRNDKTEGTGVVFTRPDDSSAYVWTVNYLPRYLFGEKFPPAAIVTTWPDESGEPAFKKVATVVRQARDGEPEVALLKIPFETAALRDAVFPESVDFEHSPPYRGDKDGVVFHVSPFISSNPEGCSTGGLSFTGTWWYEGREFEIVSGGIGVSGSGGGGVFRRDGECIGLLSRGSQDGFDLIIPTWQICEWAEKNDLLWAVDRGFPLYVRRDRPIDRSVGKE